MDIELLNKTALERARQVAMELEEVGEREQAAPSRSRRRQRNPVFGVCRRERKIECRITLPDYTMYCLNMPEDCKGGDCLKKVCLFHSCR